MRKQLLATTAVLSTLALGLAGCANSSLGADKPAKTNDGPVKVGFIVPKTGVYAAIGADLERATEIYLAEHDNKLGDRKVELVTVDEGGTAETGTAAAQRLIQSAGVDIVTGVVSSAVAAAVAPMFSDAKIPVLSTAQVEGNDYWWRVGWTNPAINVSMTDYLLGKHKNDPVYIIAADYKQGHDISADIKAGLEAGGGKVVDTAFTPFGTTQDFQPYLAKIRDSGAKVVYAFYAGGEAINFVKQFEQFGLSATTKLYANQALTEGVLGAQGASAEGVVTNGTYSAAVESKLNRKFVDAYVAKFDATPSVYSEAQYASLVVIDQALKSGKATLQDGIDGLKDIVSPRGTWHFDEGRAPTQVMYLRLATKQNGVMVNKVIDEIGVYSSNGKRQ